MSLYDVWNVLFCVHLKNGFISFVYLKCTIQWFICVHMHIYTYIFVYIYSQSCTVITMINFRTFLSPQDETLYHPAFIFLERKLPVMR